ncbi:thiolase family protein [Chelativorans sp. Marseille-P2723]|uniref:thiolase C-terminal domain-containing protein n=1 Tax=Chelativorans sp. Marseille-P2723 TaxID=2709133 RepID=UPI00156FE2FD|nr:thiolase family protein [Chelativorans sp. Marseille-P2723]
MMRAAAAIVGTGESRIGVVPDRTSMELIADAAAQALENAGLTFKDVDGLLTTPSRVEGWPMPCVVVADALGLKPSYFATVDVAGASGTSMIHQAAMAVATGACSTVLCVAGQSLLSGMSRGGAIASMATRGSAAHAELEQPLGPPIPALYALVAQRHMHEYGTTHEQMAQVAVEMRRNAGLNPNAHMREPITVEDVINAPMITSPLGRLDCSLVSDGAGAVIVTTPERARNLNGQPVWLLGAGYGLGHAWVGDSGSLTTTAAVASGADAYRGASISPSDIDFACLYDCFTITVIAELEDLGFCPKGEGGAFVESGGIARSGILPVNPHGGLLSAGHSGVPAGIFHVIEAARQIRQEGGDRQLERVSTALVHGNGGIIGVHCSLILGGADAL